MQWVSKIITVAVAMLLPAVVGMWLDRQLGAGFLALTGLIVGVPVGLWLLLRMTTGRKS